jgi:hypothetical protein
LIWLPVAQAKPPAVAWAAIVVLPGVAATSSESVFVEIFSAWIALVQRF